jgi:uncharacterized protein (TIGR00369 family)
MSISTILDQFPTPPCATLLNIDILEADRENGRVTIAFTARPEFCNASGNVQGGFLAAMLDDCMGPAILIATNAEAFPSTIDLNVQFLAPAKPGQLIGKGRVVQIGKTIGFVEANLEDANGNPIARATASVRITAMHKDIA